MLSHVALMMNPNLDEEALKRCLEKSFESKQRQLESIAEMNRELEEADKESEARDQEMLQKLKDLNEMCPDHPMPLPRVKSKLDREMDRLNIVFQMKLLVLLY